MKSMTGYGRASACTALYQITVEVHSVNHRFLEISARIPRSYSYLEEKIKAVVQQSVSRGKVDIGLSLQPVAGKSAAVSVNHGVIAAYFQAMAAENERLKQDESLPLSRQGGADYGTMVGDCWSANTVLSLCTMLRIPEAFQVQPAPEDETVVWEEVEPVLQQALTQFLTMRETEGARLCADITHHLNQLESLANRIEPLVPETVRQYHEKLYRKMQELLAERTVDEARLVTEAGLVAEKIAVDEELVRLHSHIAQFRDFLASEAPVGRKMDFLVQEMNREVNTTGSKSQSLEITRAVVDMKSEIEKIREQIQNVE